MDVYTTQEFAFVCVAATMAATLVGWLSLWSTARCFRWYWHVAPLGIALAAFVRMGGSEPVLLFGTQAATVIAVQAAILWRPRRRVPQLGEEGIRRAPRGRFGLVDVAIGIALLACMLALGRSLPTQDGVGAPIPWGRWVITGVGFGCGTIAAGQMYCTPWRWYQKFVALLLFGAIGIALVLFGDPKEAIYGYGGMFAPIDWSPEWGFALIISQVALTVLWLFLLSAAGWAWWKNGAQPNQENRSRSVSWFARFACAAMTIACVATTTECFWALLPPIAPVIQMPVDNGYDTMLRAGNLLNWNAIPGQDIDAASDQDCERFTNDNRQSLAIVREALAKPWKTLVDYRGGPSLNAISCARDLCRALDAEARSLQAIGRHDDAARCYLDMVYLGYTFGNGGLLVDDMVGNAIARIGLSNLVHAIPNLAPPILAEIAFALQVLKETRDPMEDVFAREDIYMRISDGWTGRLVTLARKRVRNDFGFEESSEHARRRVDALTELVVAESAVRRYQRLKGSPPPSLDSLVPEYLDRVPQDPFDPYGTAALIYRPTGKNYLLYSIGGDGRDDGGQRQPVRDAMYGEKSDLFFDSSAQP